MKQVDVVIEGKTLTGVELLLPGAPLVVVYSEKGFVMCGYLDLQTANKLGVAAAVVRGVKTIDDLLMAPIQGVSNAAETLGISVGQTGRQALSWLV